MFSEAGFLEGLDSGTGQTTDGNGGGGGSSVADQEQILRDADQLHSEVGGDRPEPRSARKLMKALRQGEDNVRISERGILGDEVEMYIDENFEGSKKEILKVFKSLLKGSESARALLEEAFESEEDILIRPKDDVIGGSAHYQPNSMPDTMSDSIAAPLKGVSTSDGKQGEPDGGSVFLDLDDLDSGTVPGMDGLPVNNTAETTLMHELSHAVHAAKGVEHRPISQFGNHPQEPRELAAIHHENEARNDLGLPMRAADYKSDQ